MASTLDSGSNSKGRRWSLIHWCILAAALSIIAVAIWVGLGIVAKNDAQTVVLIANETFAPTDVTAMQERLAILGIGASVESDSEQQITVTLDANFDMMDPESVLRPNRFSFHEIRDLSTHAHMSLREWANFPAGEPAYLLEFDCLRAAAWREQLQDDDECLYRFEEGGAEYCTFYCLDPAVVMTNGELESATFTTSDRPSVVVHANEESMGRWRSLSGGHAVLVDEELLTVVFISETPEETFLLQWPPYLDFATTLEKARAVTDTLQQQTPIQGRWHVSH